MNFLLSVVFFFYSLILFPCANCQELNLDSILRLLESLGQNGGGAALVNGGAKFIKPASALRGGAASIGIAENIDTSECNVEVKSVLRVVHNPFIALFVPGLDHQMKLVTQTFVDCELKTDKAYILKHLSSIDTWTRVLSGTYNYGEALRIQCLQELRAEERRCKVFQKTICDSVELFTGKIQLSDLTQIRRIFTILEQANAVDGAAKSCAELERLATGQSNLGSLLQSTLNRVGIGALASNFFDGILGNLRSVNSRS